MATPMNFQTLNFGNIPQQESEARRRYYDSLGSIGGVVANTGTKVDDYLQRKQREAEDKKKWDNMISQQEYQKNRDEIQDQRYEDELERKLNEIDAKNKALEDMKKRVGGMYDERRINEMYGYGSPAAIHYHALMSSKDLDAGQTAYNNLAGAIAQHDQMKLLREQSERSNKQDEQTKIAGNIMNSIRRQESNSKFSFDLQSKLPKKTAELKAYRDEVQANLDFLRKNEQYADYDIGFHDRIKKYKTILDAIDEKLGYTPPKKDWD